MKEEPSTSETDITNNRKAARQGKIIQLVRAGRASTVRNVVQQVFVGDYERLRDAYIHPWPVFERVNLDHFIGREWLLAEVDAFLREHNRGYFILEAEAGLGKTTFLAWLVRERGYIHHFVELTPGSDGVGRGLKNLVAQLVLAYQLSTYEAEGVLPSAAARPDYLYNLLKQVADQRQDGEKIVLVVDALDEAGTPYNQNVLGLPQVLPEGVFIIASQRPLPVTLQVDTATTPRRVFALAASSDENQVDMRRFLERAATWPGIAQAMEDDSHTPEQFTTTLLEKCGGVWIYLHYAVQEIERGERSPLDLNALPDGMTQYYAHYWGRWRDEDEGEWYGVHLLVLATLAAAQEAVTVERLAEWADVKLPERRLRRLLNERWRPFLAIAGEGQQLRYRFYHATLREFFSGKVEREKLTEAEESLVDELAEATQAAHHRLAERYLVAWGGLGAGLTRLQDAVQRDIDEGYGLRHLAAHLAASGQADDLHRLLRSEWVRTKRVPYTRQGLKGWLDRLLGRQRFRTERHCTNAWYAAKEAVGDTAGYLVDIQRAWRFADQSTERKAIALQCLYALITASVNSLATNLPPELLTALVAERVWTLDQGLACARQLPYPKQRADALMGLAPHLSESERRQALDEALSAAQVIGWKPARVEVLVGLTSHLPEPKRRQALEKALATARAIDKEAQRAKALAALAPHLPEPERRQILEEALTAARAIRGEERRAEGLAELAPHLPVAMMEEALAAVQAIDHEFHRAMALGRLALHLPRELVAEALAAARGIGKFWQTTALAGLALRLAELGYADEGLVVAREIEEEYRRGLVLAALAPNLPEPERMQVLREALATARAIEKRGERAKVLAWVTPHMPEPEQMRVLHEALALGQTTRDPGGRAKVLLELVPHLAEPERGQVLEKALVAAREIEDEQQRAEALAGLAPHLLDSLKEQALREALAAARAIKSEEQRTEELAELAPYLPAMLLEEALALV